MRLTEHDGTRAVVSIEQGDLDGVTGLELDFCGCLERQGFLPFVSAQDHWLLSKCKAYQSPFLMLVGDLLLL